MAKGDRVSDCKDFKENEMFTKTEKVLSIKSYRHLESRVR